MEKISLHIQCLRPRAILDGWLEAIEMHPSADALLAFGINTGPQPLPDLASPLQKALAELEKEKERSEKWKAKAEAAQEQLRKKPPKVFSKRGSHWWR